MERDFVLSWDRLEEFYRSISSFPEQARALDFIAALRAIGFDRTLRAGQSLYTMLLSRSLRHGLRGDQVAVAFDFRDGLVHVTSDLDHRLKITCPGDRPVKDVIDLLRRLEARPID